MGLGKYKIIDSSVANGKVVYDKARVINESYANQLILKKIYQKTENVNHKSIYFNTT